LWLVAHGDVDFFRKLFRTTGRSHSIVPGRELHGFSVVPINLRMKMKIGREAFRLGGIDSSQKIADLKGRTDLQSCQEKAGSDEPFQFHPATLPEKWRCYETRSKSVLS
jgi:hypothetical protein